MKNLPLGPLLALSLPSRNVARDDVSPMSKEKHFTSKSLFFRSIGRIGSNFLSNLRYGALCYDDTATSSSSWSVIPAKRTRPDQKLEKKRTFPRRNNAASVSLFYRRGLRKYFNTLRSIVSCHYLLTHVTPYKRESDSLFLSKVITGDDRDNLYRFRRDFSRIRDFVSASFDQRSSRSRSRFRLDQSRQKFSGWENRSNRERHQARSQKATGFFYTTFF